MAACGSIRLNGNDWSKRYPPIIQDAAKIKGSAIIDAEAVWLGLDGAASFDALHSRLNDHTAAACTFDLPMFNDEEVRRKPFIERKAMLRKVLRNTRTGIQYVEQTEGDDGKLFDAVCKLGLEGIVSKRLDAPYRSGPSKSWIKLKNPKAPAAIRVIDGTF